MKKSTPDRSVPYISSIDEGQFVPGKLIRIRGFAPEDSESFTINLQCGSEKTLQCDLALQMTIKLKKGFITLNSLQNKVWDSELRGPLCPLERAKRFEIIFECELGKYKVTINGQLYCDFPQRVHYDDITHLVIHGDVLINKIAYETMSKPIKQSRGSIINAATTFEPISFSPDGCDPDGYDDTESSVKRRRSYEAAIYSTQGGYVGAPYATSTPTLTDSSRVSPNVSPYPTNGDAGAHYTVDIPEESSAQATGPLNKAPSELRPVTDGDWKKCWSNLCGAVVGGIFILGFVLLYV